MYIQSCLLASIYVLGFLSCDRNSIQTILSKKGIYWLPVEKVTGLTEKNPRTQLRNENQGFDIAGLFPFHILLISYCCLNVGLRAPAADCLLLHMVGSGVEFIFHSICVSVLGKDSG